MVERYGEPVGYAYAKRTEHGVETAIGIAQDVSGLGIGRKALAMLIAELAEDPDWQPPYAAWIFPDNIASIRAHESAGFRLDPDAPIRMVGRQQRRWIWRPKSEMQH